MGESTIYISGLDLELLKQGHKVKLYLENVHKESDELYLDVTGRIPSRDEIRLSDICEFILRIMKNNDRSVMLTIDPEESTISMNIFPVEFLESEEEIDDCK